MAKETSISKPRLNAEWHRANWMPAKPTLDQRVAWHLAHAEACGCRDMPAGIVAELRRRGIAQRSRRPDQLPDIKGGNDVAD